ncbi:uncharacterized membrane protein (DUF485 family) [Methylohalomonas lacus]|uniref:Uncharacterized membrane protein (DUF485 family) n=1 Tax=Methylohalomonas lacus TaxID=398773 RepID=A0AAE3L5G1_9GAMM|nr:DUF485 domain-containing protein [Methylohalomonas lacus]MCS3903252.1 uncharacterized membrane protein (DUF485 family) [Methylohalomonas lacus]
MQDLYRAIHNHPEFKRLEAERARLGWSLTGVVLAIYFSFILVIAFAPELFAQPIHAGSVISWGIPLGILVILISFLLTGYYVYRANTRFDPAREALIRDIRASNPDFREPS